MTPTKQQIEKASKEHVNECGGTIKNQFDFICGANWALEQVAPRWIPVEEALPNPNPDDHYSARCLVTDGFYQEVAMYDFRYNIWIRLNWCQEITHWQHLPEPPTK